MCRSCVAKFAARMARSVEFCSVSSANSGSMLVWVNTELIFTSAHDVARMLRRSRGPCKGRVLDMRAVPE